MLYEVYIAFFKTLSVDFILTLLKKYFMFDDYAHLMQSIKLFAKLSEKIHTQNETWCTKSKILLLVFNTSFMRSSCTALCFNLLNFAEFFT